MAKRFIHKAGHAFETGGLAGFRGFVLDCVIFVILVTGFFAVIAGGIEVRLQGRGGIFWVYLGAYMTVVVSYGVRKHLTYPVRGAMVLAPLYVLAVVVLGRVGLSGAGIVMLITFSVMAAAFLGARMGAAAIAMSVAAVVGVGLGMSSGVLPVDMVVVDNSSKIEAWISAASVFILVAGVMVGCISLLLKGLQQTISRLQEKTFALEASNLKLEDVVRDQKDAQKERLRSASLLEAAMESTADGLLISDQNGKWTGYNKKFLDIWQIPPAAVKKGDGQAAIHHILDQVVSPQSFEARLEALNADPAAASFDVIRARDGRTIERYSQPHRLRGEIVGRVWSYRDVTDKLQAETELKESEEYHKGLFDSSPTALYIQDFSRVKAHVAALEGDETKDLKAYLGEHPDVVSSLAASVRIVHANQAALSMYGVRSQDELSMVFPKIILPQDRQHFIDQVCLFTRGGDWYEGEARNRDLSGRTLDIILRKVVVNRSMNGLSRILVSVVDVTALYESDRQRQALEAKLRQSQKMETMGTLAGGIAHDFNNILVPITGHAELLLSEIPDDSPMAEGLREIHKGAVRAASLVKQIMTFSRQEVSEYKNIAMGPIVAEALTLIRPTTPASIEIRQDLAASCRPVKGDPTQVHQIVMNLATNACHAMEETGGILAVRLSETRVKEGDPALVPGTYVCLEVTDSGTGMPPGVQERIFDPFFTTKEKGRGTGMGLSVVHGIVTRMGGSVRVDSTPGQGTGFRLFFPVAKGDLQDSPAAPAPPLAGGKEHILMVDDEPSVVALQSRFLERQGYNVTGSNDSPAAFEMFRKDPGRYDLVISDVAMPDLTGDQLARQMLEISPETRILLCTGFSETITEAAARRIGVRALIMKPVALSDLAAVVRRTLDDQD